MEDNSEGNVESLRRPMDLGYTLSSYGAHSAAQTYSLVQPYEVRNHTITIEHDKKKRCLEATQGNDSHRVRGPNTIAAQLI